MDKSDDELFIDFINLIGGTTRFYLVSVYRFVTFNKIKIKRDPYIYPPNKTDNYFKNTDTHFKNVIACILILFIILSLVFKLINFFF